MTVRPLPWDPEAFPRTLRSSGLKGGTRGRTEGQHPKEMNCDATSSVISSEPFQVAAALGAPF